MAGGRSCAKKLRKTGGKKGKTDLTPPIPTSLWNSFLQEISKWRFSLNQQCFQTSLLISRELHKAQEKGCCPEELWGLVLGHLPKPVCLDVVLGSPFWVSLLEQGVDKMTSRGPFPLQPSCDYVKFVGGLLSKQGFKIEPPVAELLCQ